MWYDNSSIFNFSSVNMSTGQIIFNYQLPSIQIIVSGTSMINSQTNQYILKANFPYRYFTINIPTSSIANNVLAPDDIRMLQMHPTTNIAYGLWYNSFSTFHLVSINTMTGIKTVLDTLNNVQAIVSETAVINSLTNQYVFKGTHPSSANGRYFTIDIATGAVVNDTIAPDDIRMLQIHPTTNIVYGLWYDSFSTFHLVSINTMTGIKTVLDTLNNVQAIVSETAVINSLTNQYVFKGTHPSSANGRYFTIDIATGAVVNDTIAPDDIRMLEISSTITSVNETKKVSNFNIYPNPFHQSSNIDFENPKNETCTLTIYDSQGKLVRTINNINSDKVEIERKDLVSGLYFFQLRSDMQIIATGKLVAD